MLVVKRNGREVAAMIMNEPVNNVAGVVQCTIDGCQGYMPIMAGVDENGVKEASPAQQVEIFLETHDCDPNRFPKKNGPRRN